MKAFLKALSLARITYLSWKDDLKSPYLLVPGLGGWFSVEHIKAQSVLSYLMCKKAWVSICPLENILRWLATVLKQ